MDRLQQGFGIHVLILRHEQRKPHLVFRIHPEARKHDIRRAERDKILLRRALLLCKLRAGSDDSLLRRRAPLWGNLRERIAVLDGIELPRQLGGRMALDRHSLRNVIEIVDRLAIRAQRRDAPDPMLRIWDKAFAEPPPKLHIRIGSAAIGRVKENMDLAVKWLLVVLCHRAEEVDEARPIESKLAHQPFLLRHKRMRRDRLKLKHGHGICLLCSSFFQYRGLQFFKTAHFSNFL